MSGSVLAIVDVFVIRIHVLSFILKARLCKWQNGRPLFRFLLYEAIYFIFRNVHNFLDTFFSLINRVFCRYSPHYFIFIASASNNWTYYISSRYLFDWYSTSNTLLKIPRFLFSPGIYLPKRKGTLPHRERKRNQTKYLPPVTYFTVNVAPKKRNSNIAVAKKYE